MLSLQCELQRTETDRAQDPAQRNRWHPALLQMRELKEDEMKTGGLNPETMNRSNTGAGERKNAARLPGDRGMMTVEATVIVPIILLIITAAVLLYLAIGKREALRGDMYVALYTLGIADEKDGSPADTLSGKADRFVMGSTAVTASSRVVGDELIMTGTVRYLDGRVPAAIARFRKDMPVITMRERDLCSERLRRWQFYGNLTENTGD